MLMLQKDGTYRRGRMTYEQLLAVAREWNADRKRDLSIKEVTVGEVFDPRMIRSMKITKDELPGYRDGSDPFYQAPAEPAKK